MRLALTGLLAAMLLGAAAVTRAGSHPPTQNPDSVAVELFMPGLVSTPLDELNAAFTPDGRELYWSINSVQNQPGMGVIVVSRLQRDNRWSTPEATSFSGPYSDYDPFVAPDGQRLFFISNRPKGAATWNANDYDVYVVERQGGGWGEARRLAAPVNSDGGEFYPSVAANGTLYFSTQRPGSRGYDIFLSRWADGRFQEPENLGDSVNGTANTGEFDIYVAPDESFLVFAAGRPGGVGGQDLWVSFNRSGVWSAARLLPRGINSPAREYCPIGSPDGRYLYFTSMRGFTMVPPSRQMLLSEWRDSIGGIRNGNGNVYRVPLTAITRLNQ